MAYVDKEKFKRKLQYIFKTYRMSEIITEKVKHALDDTTVDAVKVCRCKDCKSNPGIKTLTKGTVWCRKFRAEVHPDGFCSYGERTE